MDISAVCYCVLWSPKSGTGMHPVRRANTGVCAALVEVAGLGAVPALSSVPIRTPLGWEVLAAAVSCGWLCLAVGLGWGWGWLLKIWFVLNPTETFNIIPVSLHTGRLSDREEDRTRTVQ